VVVVVAAAVNVIIAHPISAGCVISVAAIASPDNSGAAAEE
jgi:hypothetical protein